MSSIGSSFTKKEKKLKLELIDTIAKMTHKGQSLEWNVKEFKPSVRAAIFQRSTDPDEEDIVHDPFAKLNPYFAHLTEEKQDKLWDLYNQAMEVFLSSTGDMTYLVRELSNIVKEIWLVCPLSDVAYWVKSLSGIRIPPDAKIYPTMEENAKNGELYGSNNWPRESAYLTEDYWNLIYMIASLRLLYPIWGMFVLHAHEEAGANMKHFYALKIITSTSIVESEGYKQLQRYLKHHLVIDQSLDRNVFNNGVSTADLQEWFTSMVVVRKFSQFDYSGENPKFNMVATVFRYVFSTTNSMSGHLKRVIQPKIHEGSGFQGDQEKRPDSPFEMVKIKEDQTTGDIVIMNECALDTHSIAQRLCPDLPQHLLQDAIDTAQNVWMNVMFEQSQITILQWVMGKEYEQFDHDLNTSEWDVVFQPRGVDELERDGILSLMAAAAATLWHRGYHDLAALMTAKKIDPRESASILRPEPPLPLTKENLAKLSELYPHVQRQKDSKRDPNKKADPVIKGDIEILREQFAMYNWNLTIPKSWLDNSNLTRGNRRYVVKANIRNSLAELSIAIASRTF